MDMYGFYIFVDEIHWGDRHRRTAKVTIQMWDDGGDLPIIKTLEAQFSRDCDNSIPIAKGANRVFLHQTRSGNYLIDYYRKDWAEDDISKIWKTNKYHWQLLKYFSN